MTSCKFTLDSKLLYIEMASLYINCLLTISVKNYEIRYSGEPFIISYAYRIQYYLHHLMKLLLEQKSVKKWDCWNFKNIFGLYYNISLNVIVWYDL